MNTKILLYNFTVEEYKEWTLALKHVPMVDPVFVDRESFHKPLGTLLGASVETFQDLPDYNFDGRMLVLVNASGKVFQYLLAVSKMVTKEHIYCAVLTETNQSWTSSYLYEHLVEEEAEMMARRSE